MASPQFPICPGVIQYGAAMTGASCGTCARAICFDDDEHGWHGGWCGKFHCQTKSSERGCQHYTLDTAKAAYVGTGANTHVVEFKRELPR